MSFDLCNVAAMFQELVNYIFCDRLRVCVVVYPDDICVFSSDLHLQRKHLHIVLSHLQESHLFAMFKKCLIEHSSLLFPKLYNFWLSAVLSQPLPQGL